MSKYTYPNPPKLMIFEIITWMQKNPDSVYHNTDISKHFNITMSDACNRSQRLRRNYGLLNYYDTSDKKKGFILSAYGKKFKTGGS
ncbi:MAG: hypothetical protein DDT22_00237 [candidate division WS2 bacterium]|nr:hypothetical protein [Candidatus Lithacetigena glycinireducens]